MKNLKNKLPTIASVLNILCPLIIRILDRGFHSKFSPLLIFFLFIVSGALTIAYFVMAEHRKKWTIPFSLLIFGVFLFVILVTGFN